MTEGAEDKLVDAMIGLSEKQGRNGDLAAAVSDLFTRCVHRQEGRLAAEKPADKSARQILIESDIPEG